MNKKSPSGAQSVLRAIKLLKSFTLDEPEKDVASLAKETGLSRGTVHRLLSALESEGLVERLDSNGRYRLGPSVVMLGARALRSNTLRERVHPHLEELAETTGETATLEVLAEGKMLILDEVLGAHLIAASPSLGTAWALHATSTGKALLAELGPARARRLLTFPLERFTPHTITSEGLLERELSRIRKDGFATVQEELEVGYSAAGAVIRMPIGEPKATLSVGGPSSRIKGKKLRELGGLLVSRTNEVARSLGVES